MKQKYQKVTGWWVYIHKTPDNMYYPGCSGQTTNKRWTPSAYKQTTLKPYIEQYGWDNIEHLVVIDNITEKEARKLEEKFINMYTQFGCCINKWHSGGNRWHNGSREKLEYNKKWYQDNIEHIQEYHKQYRKENKNYYTQYNKEYYQKHKEKIKEYKKQYYQKNNDVYKQYMKEYYITHKEELEKYEKQRSVTPERKIYQRVRNYNKYHTPIETPLEAKLKYLETGYIPDYIKSDDLIQI